MAAGCWFVQCSVAAAVCNTAERCNLVNRFLGSILPCSFCGERQLTAVRIDGDRFGSPTGLLRCGRGPR